MSVNKTFIFDTLKYIPIKVLPAFAGVLTVFFLTKQSLLDTASYVNYTFIMAALLIFAQIVGGWVNSSVIYYHSSFDNDEEKKFFIINISYLQWFFLLLGSIGLFFTIFIAIQSLLISLFIVLILVFQIFLNFNYSFFQAKREITRQINATFIQALFQIVGIIVCYFFFKGSLDAVFFFLLLSYAVTSVFIVLQKKNLMHFDFNLKTSFDITFCKKILSYGLPICLWFFSTQLYQIGDRILFKYFNFTDHVGNYVSFRDLAVGLSGFISMPLLFASHPIIMQLSKNEENKPDIESLLRKNILILTAIFLPIIVISYFYGEDLIKYIVGEKYLLNPVLMSVVLFTILLGCISIYLQKGIESKGNTMLMLKISLLVACISILLNIIFIKKHGIVSSIYISLISHLLYCLGIYFYSRKIFKIFF
ncbi:hypothetical protein EG359_09480 [Chryseobacterium joostei]|uniref:Membrane protein involved in the export of O-antigen and teichoic acid n=1 Tax=Chryseobacterium joostei TaxID=112234 RepID=A0A1N7I3V2_9FLAO|nr:oligosaccharide flippase family protein [Chryseobacterium joostei]AZA99836.1 hypothetical protein EG359_09480 [Chryseobacterium joostei]SIS31734.1 Membrane protein involved in the export of O-antigen and teichoic acid [Chryseobacterium joostei]